MKITHLHLVDPFGNPATLICNLVEGSINYVFYSGHSSGGTPYSLSNLQCTLPVDKISETETKDRFAQRVKDIIREKSVYYVVNQIKEVVF